MQLEQITPFVPCADLEKQITFCEEALGFEATFDAGSYAFSRRDDVAIKPVQAWSCLDLSHSGRQRSFNVDVYAIGAFYTQLSPAIGRRPVTRVGAPFDQEYGPRDFHVAAEDCTLVFFEEALSQ